MKDTFSVTPDTIVIQRTPDVAMGDLATPLPFTLAKSLRRNPREIATELVAALPVTDGIAKAVVAGGGYVNFHLERGAFVAGLAASLNVVDVAGGERTDDAVTKTDKIIVEHTNINPNKAAHIGHLRNAVLGDTFVRMLRFTGETVEVQNYIDNTGVQVADVVVGFEHLEKKTLAEVEALIREDDSHDPQDPPFDYYCWDLYAKVTRFYEDDPELKSRRSETLKEIEEGVGATAELAELIASAIVKRHLLTAARVGVEYDVLPRESEILHLKFWDAAFEQLKASGAVVFSETGKTAGCWVMPERQDESSDAPEAGSESSDNLDASDNLDEAKVIVRSNGTVTYVGKDIAYQMWKFGLLGKDFGYRRFHQYPDGRMVWMSSAKGEAGAPKFGGGAQVYNVIDARQSYLQTIVADGLRALGYADQAARSTHFSYEMVGLTPRCASELGVTLSDAEKKKSFVEVSGRKGLGVKADDLLDRLEAKTLEEVRSRHADLSNDDQVRLAHKIAVAAIRFFLLKFTRNSLIAFDFAEALSFEGETGPYLQYSVVRANNIFRKARDAGEDVSPDGLAAQLSAEQANTLLSGEGASDLWDLALSTAELNGVVEVAVREQEPATVAKWAFALAQQFNLFYHRHHILRETDGQKKALLLTLTNVARQNLTAALDLLGIEIPEKM